MEEIITKESNSIKGKRRFIHHKIEEVAQDVLSGNSDFPIDNSPAETADYLQRLATHFGKTSEKIPFFVVGFLGWSDPELIIQKMEGTPIDGIFLIEPKIFVSGNEYSKGSDSLIMFLERLERELLNKSDRLNVLNNYFKR